MDDSNTGVMQGTLDMGSLLTAFERLECAGWPDAVWRQTENSRRARFYSLAIAPLLKAEG